MEEKLYLLAIKYLSFRPRSEKEVKDYLAKKFKIQNSKLKSEIQNEKVIEDIIEEIIAKLKEQKFLNNEEFTKIWVRSRKSFKPKGERLIRLELKQKGISQENIDKAFENSEDGKNDLELASEILEKKKKKFESMERAERFNKAGAFMARRGFDLDTIKKAIDQVFGKMV